jgi:CRP/FNR family cyclic AMP-dependent transcriptional regulator
MMSPTIEKYKDGALVFRQGQRGDRMYIVMSGAIRIFREDRGVETTLAQLGFGETFGELALFDHHPRSASARAIGDTELRVITHEEFLELDCDGIIRQMLVTLAQRLRSIDEAFERLSAKEAPERERLAELIRTRDWVDLGPSTPD